MRPTAISFAIAVGAMLTMGGASAQAAQSSAPLQVLVVPNLSSGAPACRVGLSAADLAYATGAPAHAARRAAKAPIRLRFLCVREGSKTEFDHPVAGMRVVPIEAAGVRGVAGLYTETDPDTGQRLRLLSFYFWTAGAWLGGRAVTGLASAPPATNVAPQVLRLLQRLVPMEAQDDRPADPEDDLETRYAAARRHPERHA